MLSCSRKPIPMLKDGDQHSDDAAPVRIEVVPRRGLSRQEAACYVGISTTKFDELLREERMPEPLRTDLGRDHN